MYHPASPLSKASALLESLSADSLPNDKLEQMSQDLRARRDFPGPSADRLGSVPLTARSESSNANMGFLGGNVDLDQMVYPVGQTNGIDPINSDHINNIPYALPDTSILNMPPAPSLPQANGLAPPQPTRARVLLVEDDLTCAKIGAKFLDFYECDCVHAVGQNV